MKQAYHHGDLHKALLDEALKMVAEAGSSALTMRELGRRLGVSHAAVYGHYPDKHALIQDVAMTGFDNLARACKTARAKIDDPSAAFTALGKAYLKFARTHPHLYRLMFSDNVLTETHDSKSSPNGVDAFEQLAQVVAELTHLKRKEAFDASISVWAGIHGLAMLELDNRIGASVKATTNTFKTMNAVLLKGIQNYTG